MRVETLLRLCGALHVTPNDILTETDEDPVPLQEELLAQLSLCSAKDQETAMRLLKVFLHSLN